MAAIASLQPSAVLASRRQTDDPVQIARDLLPLLRRNAGQSELDRRLAKESGDALRAKGLFQLLAPRRVGGYEANIRTYVEVCAELSKGDSAAGWVVMILAGNAFLMGMCSDRVRDDVYGTDPLAGVCGQWAPSSTCVIVEGGYSITGKWMWASGCYESQWTVVGFPVDRENGAKEIRLGLVPTNELTIQDTWYVAGMSGTGSNTFVAKDVFVPAHRTLRLDDVLAGVSASEHDDEPLYSSPIVTALPLAICGTILGMGEAAWEMTLATLAKGKSVVGSIYTDARLSPSYQLNLADARAALDSAWLHVMRAADDIDNAVGSGIRMDDLARARVRLDEATALTRSRQAVDLLLNISGASGFASVSPIQRVWRDMEVASRHAYTNGDLGREIYGRAILGLEQVSAAF